MASKQGDYKASIFRKKKPARGAQSKASARSSASAPATPGSSKMSRNKKPPPKKAPATKANATKKDIPKKSARLELKKDSKKETKANAATPKFDPDAIDPEPVEDDDNSKFTLFNKLALELRLRIWGFAAPGPCVVVQRESFHTTVRFRYIRDGGKVPGVLHACRESRNEFLEKDGDDPTLGRRRREHPVYKLYFHTRRTRTSRPVFFSPDVDTFWATNHTIGSGYRSHNLSGIAELDAAKDLKHLAVNWGYIYWSDWDWYNARFPKLETLTLLQWDEQYLYMGREWCTINCPPEIDGQLSMIGIAQADKDYIEYHMQSSKQLKEWLEEEAEQHTDQKFPQVKLRFRHQFIQNEGITIPKQPKDPLDDLE